MTYDDADSRTESMWQVETSGGERSGGLRRSLLSAKTVRSLSERDGPRSLVNIAVTWAAIIGAGVLAVLVGRWWAYLIAIAIIGTRQHALAVLMHDGAHGLLLRGRVRNRVVSEALLAWPLLLDSELYRLHHMRHHRYLNSSLDPDLDTTSGAHAYGYWILLGVCDLSGLSALRALRSANQFSIVALVAPAKGDLRSTVGRGWIASFLTIWITIIGVAIALGFWLQLLLLWFVPIFTILVFVLRIRGVAEHVGCPNTTELDASRVISASLLERALFAPFGVNYHLDHHLFPTVPHFALAELHDALEQSDIYRKMACNSRHYLLGSESVLRAISA